ncbi:MAG: cytidylate kinase-like family protein [Oscillospiraceae bacterium]|nr:cytidylate kinase-like family protein [Oscillospiraceae bacterium]
MNTRIITISREYGSGGRSIGEMLATAADIPYYDKQIVHLAAEKGGLSPDVIENTDESIPSTFRQRLTYTDANLMGMDALAYYSTPTTDKVFLAQSEVIREIADEGPCIIVGRCAGYVLKNRDDVFSIFIHANTEDRLQRGIDQYGLSAEDAIDMLRKIDKSRINYYRYYTNRTWGNVKDYDLALNTSFTGIEGAVNVIKAMLTEGINWRNR